MCQLLTGCSSPVMREVGGHSLCACWRAHGGGAGISVPQLRPLCGPTCRSRVQCCPAGSAAQVVRMKGAGTWLIEAGMCFFSFVRGRKLNLLRCV